ncbi:MAG: glutamate synthase-related protein [Candidatus Gastranaerophilales bacterium]|nr:glutamate synthase-related protein [Candidatus Gastranaerophilales bacterium]
MAAVKVNELHIDDLPWLIEYDEAKCIRCGKCTAVCSFKAIEPKVEKRKKESSLGQKPSFAKVVVIKQVVSHKNHCKGCGMCTYVCPTGAIKPVRNTEDRYATRYRADMGDSLKKGGRSNLNTEGRTLDKIKIGRISQMTDPSLDALRHTFELRTPFGRVLSADKLQFDLQDGQLQLQPEPLPPNEWIYPIIMGDMSIGAISWRMWEAMAIATAYLNEVMGIPIRMCSGEGGVPVRLLKSKYLKYMILQIASGHFGWNRIVQAMPEMTEDPAGIIIKIGQGAKPGDGGLLMANKVARYVQEIRGVPKADLLSPPTHQGLYSIEESVQKMFLSMNAAFKFRVPVAIKVAASVTSVSVYNNLLRDPYNIVGGFFLDGLAAGTGAAHEISLDHTGHPIVSKVRDCYLAAVHQGRQGEIPLFAGGGLGKNGSLAADAFKMICLGANGVFTGRLLLEIAGCVGNDTGKCNSCNSGLCPSGITTQDMCLTKRLDIDEVAQNIVNYIVATDVELKKLMAPIGNSSLPVGRSDALITVDKNISTRLDIQHVC